MNVKAEKTEKEQGAIAENDLCNIVSAILGKLTLTIISGGIVVCFFVLFWNGVGGVGEKKPTGTC